MKLKNLLVILVAVVFVFAISCKEKTKETAPAKAEVKAPVQAVEKAEAKEAVEKEGEEKGEKEEKGEEAEEQAKKAKVELPAAIAKAVNENVPGAEIDIVEVEKEGGISLYDIEFKAGKGEIEVAEFSGVDATWAKPRRGEQFAPTDLVYLKR
jgi:uncharacterized membrane protein YkoI